VFISHACQGWTAWEAGRIDKEFDPVVFKEPQLMEIRRHIQLGLLCVQQDRTNWPTMADVLQMLSGKKDLPTPKKPTYTESYDKWIPAGNRFESYMESIPSPGPFVQPADTNLYEEKSPLIPRQ
jgi:hypothetical protein